MCNATNAYAEGVGINRHCDDGTVNYLSNTSGCNVNCKPFDYMQNLLTVKTGVGIVQEGMWTLFFNCRAFHGYNNMSYCRVN